MSSDTPRTDAMIMFPGSGIVMVRPEFARELERALAAKQAEVERLQEIITVASRDRNAHGKTLLDLHAIWLEQEKDSNRSLRQRVEELEGLLLKCREEFCWHGNTGKTLSAESYGQMVDSIDRALSQNRLSRPDETDQCAES